MVLPERLLGLFGGGGRCGGRLGGGQRQALLALVLPVLGAVVAEHAHNGHHHAAQVGAGDRILEQQQRHRDDRDSLRHIRHSVGQRGHQLTENRDKNIYIDILVTTSEDLP